MGTVQRSRPRKQGGAHRCGPGPQADELGLTQPTRSPRVSASTACRKPEDHTTSTNLTPTGVLAYIQALWVTKSEQHKSQTGREETLAPRLDSGHPDSPATVTHFGR